MKILFITIVFIAIILYTHRYNCKNHPLMIAGKKVRYVSNYKNKYRAQIKFPIWGWLDVTYSCILDSRFNYFPEFETREKAENFLMQLNDSMLDPENRGSVKIQTYTKDYSGNKKHFEEEEGKEE